jgi:uridylate kinase
VRGRADGQGVDGVYDADPRTNPDAELFDEISHDEVLAAA